MNISVVSIFYVLKTFSGPTLPSGLCCGAMGSNPNGVVIAGGFDGNRNVDDIIAMNCAGGNCLWEMVSKSLDFPRNDHLGIMIPDGLAGC